MTAPPLEPVKEWNAGVYHRVSTPQIAWGHDVLERLELTGSETVIDAGCGSGHLTAALLERLPTGKVIAVDQSVNMLAEAKGHLAPRFGDRVAFLQADVQDLSLDDRVDAIFSTATFHWVLDHPRLFRVLYECLKPGGRLVAQFGGGANIARLRHRAEALLDSETYREAAAGWQNPWHFATAETTAERLRAAGFEQIETSVEPSPTTFPDAAAFREFVTMVVLRAHLEAIESAEIRERFMDELTDLAARDEPPFLLDYWRLNLSAVRPPAT